MAQIEEFPKFQYSEFIKTPTQDGQYVVRAETIEDFEKSLASMRKVLGITGSKAGTATSDEPPHPASTETKWCSQHGVEMVKEYSKTKKDENGNPKAYFSHRENGQMCFGSGLKS